ncbi:hypothetical protein [Neptunitalea chrysea]|nr:hypothetical protein [Neptunitalea chrysea]
MRKPNNKAFLSVMLRPLELLHLDFLNFRANSIYRVKHNSQIVYMEAMLNDLFDPLERRIRIVNTEFKQPVYFYEPLENREVYHYEPEDNDPVHYYEPDDIVGDGVDFSVCVPPQLQPEGETAETAILTRMRGEIDYYKLYSKNYNILWVQVNN